MSLNSLEKLLTLLQQQPGWEQYRQYLQVVAVWQQVIDYKLANYTRPLYISRQVLWVAIASYSLAQELSLQRFSLLQQLNQQLPFQLKDLRFSPNHWYQKTNSHPDSLKSNRNSPHPSQIELSPIETEIKNTPPAQELAAAVERWAKILQARSQTLPSCPRCGCPTPLGELQRWQLCYHCIAQQWSNENSRTLFITETKKNDEKNQA